MTLDSGACSRTRNPPEAERPSGPAVGPSRGLVAGTALLLSACGSPLEALNAITPDTGFQRQAGVAFGEASRQKLDVYRAIEPADNAHTVVFVYGGAWRMGKREDYAFVAGELAGAGHDVIVPDYRLYPQVSWPAFIEDVALAIEHVDTHAGTLLGRELDEVVLMGHSSGAHSAAVIAADSDRWLVPDAVRISGLIGIAGPYDLPLTDPEVAPVFEGVGDADRAIPVALVDADHPPTLLLHGSDDERVLPKHTERYARALRDAEVAVQVTTLEGTGHAGSIASFAAPLSLLNEASEHTLDWLGALEGGVARGGAGVGASSADPQEHSD